ncbi:hypothetical protein QCM80_22130 [Bradyrhizobium sp. SSUT112]|uniref:hypothetical protein n=1 Tax=Bradyrhizobium sp. SSUT112 TaxID=3040604 RepID=UPI0024478E18|nr:hypothetical protein [Bradyrhizobium sp. SSUT112]MDH2353336.1 hypothetical protein [Bradyrhizobium sp. SSUT112]
MALEDLFHEALREFLAHEYTLVRKDVHEQSLCGRLAIYLDRAKNRDEALQPYFVDVEYNRRGEGRKQILHPVTHEHIDVRCDILLHSRGDLDDDNLIAVEMKKDDGSAADKQSDRERLQALTLPMPEDGNPDYVCGFKLGYYLEVHIGNGTLLVEEYRGGKMTPLGTAEFARRSRSDSSSFAKAESRTRKSARRKS